MKDKVKRGASKSSILEAFTEDPQKQEEWAEAVGKWLQGIKPKLWPLPTLSTDEKAKRDTIESASTACTWIGPKSSTIRTPDAARSNAQ